MNTRYRKILTRTVAALVVLIIVVGSVFFYLFPWALDNESIAGVEGPYIPLLSIHEAKGDMGASVYGRTCFYCHDTDIGPSLRDRALPAEMVKYFVRNGSRAMPPFRRSEISDAELDAITVLISTNMLPEIKQ